MKKVLISILTIFFIISMAIIVKAESSSISAGASVDSVIRGKTFTVTLAGVSDTPIDGMYTKFSYDTSAIKLTSKSTVSGYGDNSSDGEILITNNSTTTSPTSGTLYTLTFEVLDTASVGETKITFSGSELHLNSNGTISQASTSIEDVTVTIKADETTVENENKNENTNINSSNSNTNTNNSNSNNNTINATKKTTKLPQTGVENTSIIAIMFLAIISIVSYISYRKYKNV